MDDENGIKILTDDEYAEQMNRIIKRDYFPYQETLRRKNDLLKELQNSSAVYENNDKILTPTPTPILPKIDKDENAVSAKNKSLDDFARSNASSDELAFQKIVAKNNRELAAKFWWVENNSSVRGQTLALPSAGRKLFLEAKKNAPDWTENKSVARNSDEEPMQVSRKNHLMFMSSEPAAIEEGFVKAKKASFRSENTRFKTPTARENSESKIDRIEQNGTPSVGGFRLVESTPQIEPSAGNVSPLVTWGSIQNTPLRLEDEDDLESKRVFKMFEKSRKEKAHHSLAKKIKKARNGRNGTPLSTPGKFAGVSMSPFGGLSPAGMFL
ncbi:DiGeorge syndrome critical region protein 14, variant 2 [Bonamia ostreae]|uniref:DiGeorge syndrome critical region protein 14, variant 2 n=1 Tax=Bonamia ostreae TaxID=126728 RepID=A0ABV2AIZ3_9EUKA